MLFALLLACTGTPEDTAVVDGCADAPVVTYETFGAGFLVENCQSCHASTAPDRKGAPDAVIFDTVDDAWAFKERILVRAAIDVPDMPPQGGTTADDRTLLMYWLNCAEEGT